MLTLVMSGLITVAQLPLDLYQVFHVHTGGKRMSASSAFSRLFGSSDNLIKANTNLRGPLKDMEELSKREPKERDDHGYRVSERQKLITVAAQPGVAHRQQETRETHGKQQNQRKDIFPEKLNRGGSFITHAAVHSNHDTRHNEEGCPDQPVKDDKAENGFYFEYGGREAEDKDPVAVQIAWHRFEHEPAKDQGKGDQGCND